jgi:hypothetical protein
MCGAIVWIAAHAFKQHKSAMHAEYRAGTYGVSKSRNMYKVR